MINNLASLKEYYLKIANPIVGVAVYAFDRLEFKNLAKKYRIIALRYSKDTKLIEKDIEVLSLEKGMGSKHIREPRNTTTILTRLKKSRNYLNKLKQPVIVLRNASGKILKAARDNDWIVAANEPKFRKALLEDKIKFRKILTEIDAPIVPGKIKKLADLHYGHLMNNYGLPFVLQHPTKGGGKGTFFINSKDDYDVAIKKLGMTWDAEDQTATKAADEVLVAKFITGPSPSLTACVTNQGILSTNLQLQVLDMPELYNPAKGSGLFCGHDWTSSRFNNSVNQQAYDAVERIGQYFLKLGYRGIFGLDFILDEKTQKLSTVECNPRFVASFPTLTMAQELNNEPPIIAFHVLEFMKKQLPDFSYDLDIEALNKLMRQPKKGGQMFIRNLTNRWARNHRSPKAGVYKLKNGKIKYLRPGYELAHIKNKGEFIITGGIHYKKSPLSPNRRLARILTLDPLLDKSYKSLNDWASQVARASYQAFDIKPVRWVRLRKFFNPHFLAKG